LRRLFSTFFYTGYCPIAPGTAASALSAGAALGLYSLGVPWWAMAALALCMFFAAVPLANWAIGHFGSADPTPFVLDEVVGMWISALVLYGCWKQPAWAVLLIAFFWFRLFDIVKPPPVRQSESIGRGWGVCLDDLLAGLYALGASWLTVYLWVQFADGQGTSYLQAVVLAVVQGLTEFLPVSSSGHLSLIQSFFEKVLGVEQGRRLFFDVAVHVGTLISILLVFWRPFFRLLARVGQDMGTVLTSPANLWRRPSLRILLFVIVASVPTFAIGAIFKYKQVPAQIAGADAGDSTLFDYVAGNPAFVSLMLIATGGILFLSRIKRRQKRGIRNFGIAGAFILGLAQGVAVTPGISRSGMTISAGLLLGLRRRWCVLLSFLILVPATLGALAVEIRDVANQQIGISDLLPILLATGISAVVGFFALKLLVYLVIHRRFHWFAYYCWAVGGAFLLYRLLA